MSRRSCRARVLAPLVDLPARTVWLSKTFDWFEGDFVADEKRHGIAAPTLIDYVNRYRPPTARLQPGLRVRFLDYDKRLNRQTDPH